MSRDIDRFAKGKVCKIAASTLSQPLNIPYKDIIECDANNTYKDESNGNDKRRENVYWYVKQRSLNAY